MFVNIHLYDGLARRAAYPIYLRFKVNRFELWMLSSLCGYLAYKEKTIVSKQEFFSYITGNGKDRKKQEGFYYGLLNKGLIGQYEYILVPGSQSIGISDFGIVVLNQYLESVQAMLTRYTKKEIKFQVAEPGAKYRRTA